MFFQLKRLAPGDESVLISVAEDVFDETIDPARLADYLRSPGHMMVLALDGGLVIGQCTGVVHRHPDKATELYVDEVGTASRYLRQGVAKAMLQELFAWGRELGCEEAWLGTELDNAAANALYQGVPPIEDETMRFYLFQL